MRVLNKRLPSPIEDIDLGTLLRPNYRGYVEKAAVMPLRLIGTARKLLANLGDVSLMDFGVGLAEGLPTGIYSGSGIGRYVEEVLSDPDRDNDFRLLDRELYLTATDLDTCERIILGEGDWADVPISKAVECSTALPVVYEPVELKGRQLIDGGIRSTTNVDIAVERGAKFIVVVNPAGPLRQRLQAPDPDLPRDPGAPRLRHGAAGDRQPDLQADRPRPPPPGGRLLAGEVPGRRHPADRARAQRRADVRDLGDGLLRSGWRSPATASSRSPSPWPRTTSATRRSPSATTSRSPRAGCAR